MEPIKRSQTTFYLIVLFVILGAVVLLGVVDIGRSMIPFLGAGNSSMDMM